MTEPRIEWLRKQIDDDEGIARYTQQESLSDAVKTMSGDGRHKLFLARYDPARVLREVEAKRQILARYAAWQKSLRGGAESPAPSVAIRVLAAMLHDIVADLAAVYSDREGYAEHWGGNG